MIDLIRLMHDDGASRPPVKPQYRLPDVFFMFKGTHYRGTYVEAKDYIGKQITDCVSLFGPDHKEADNPIWGVHKFLENPGWMLERLRGRWQKPGDTKKPNEGHIRDDIIWYQFEPVYV